MNHIQVIPDLTQPTPGLKIIERSKIDHITEGVLIGRMPEGTQAGQSTVMIFADLPNGRTVCLEMTMASFQAAATVLQGVDDAGKISKQGRG